jgi:hypothetical protein
MHLLIHMSSVICCPLQGYHPLDTDLSAVSTNEYGGKLPIFSTSTEHATPEDADMWIKDGMSLEMSITCEENDPTKATFIQGDRDRATQMQAAKMGAPAPGGAPGSAPAPGGAPGPAPVPPPPPGKRMMPDELL